MLDSDSPPWGFAARLPLSLQSVCLGAHVDPDGAFARHLLERLRRASQLTALLLQSGFTDAATAPVLRGGVFGEGLPSLVALRTVRLEGWRITEADALWRGLAELPALRSLHIHYVQVKVLFSLAAGHLTCMAPCSLYQCLPPVVAARSATTTAS